MPTDINRGTGGLVLPAAVSTEILGNVLEASAVQRAARRIVLPGNGVSVPVITGEPVAAFTGETELKPVSRSTFANKLMRAHTLSFIEPFSNQFRRDFSSLYTELQRRLPTAIGIAFDKAVMFGTGAPASDFDTLATAPVVKGGVADKYGAWLAALQATSNAGGDATAIIVSPAGEFSLLGARDADGRPLFILNPQTDGSIGSLFGRPVYRSRAAAGTDTLGFVGNWDRAVWGQVAGLSIDISDQATLTDGGTAINLWQQNMFAVRVEVEVGFRVAAVNEFVRVSNAAA